MTLLYYDDAFLQHDTGPHPECADRLRAVVAQLTDTDLLARCERPTWNDATPEQIALAHDADYIKAVRQFAERGGGAIEADTIVSRPSYDVARKAVGAVCDAVDRVITGEERRALCLVRPPGHHALRQAPMGFCLFSNVSVGALWAAEHHALDRVLIVDWDVHHGNGTQNVFWADPRVGFLSIHRWPFYPGSGDASETGTGDALGTTVNVPVEFGTSRKDYLAQFESALTDLAAKIRPQLVIVSAGFDSHRADPVGSLGLEIEDFAPLSQAVLDVADSYADGKLVSVLEGGYNPEMLAGCVELHLAEMMGRKT
jgi:acetoin utilization deacetylase AcuC-like enzyme